MRTLQNIPRTISHNGVIFQTHPLHPQRDQQKWLELKRTILDAEDFGYMEQRYSYSHGKSMREPVFHKLVDNNFITKHWKHRDYYHELATIKQSLLPILQASFERAWRKFEAGAFITSKTHEHLGGEVDAFIDEDYILVISKATTTQTYRELIAEDNYHELSIAQAKASLLLALTGRREAYIVIAHPQFELMPFHVSLYQPEAEAIQDALKKAKQLLADSNLELNYFMLLFEDKVMQEQRNILNLNDQQLVNAYYRFYRCMDTALNSDDYFE